MDVCNGVEGIKEHRESSEKVDWQIPFVQFMAMMPGPDGIPYIAWNLCFQGQVILYSCY